MFPQGGARCGLSGICTHGRRKPSGFSACFEVGGQNKKDTFLLCQGMRLP